MYNYIATTKRGLKKISNEDRITINNNYISTGDLNGTAEGLLLAVLCDGVSGEAFGEKAAEIASLSFLPISSHQLSIFDIAGAVFDANNAVCFSQKQDLECRNMSTSLAGLYIHDDRYVAFNTGDSRVYIFQNGILTQLSKDHTEAQRLVDNGKLSKTEDAPSALRNTIYRYIGGSTDTGAPALMQGTVDSSGCIFLLCSDGIYKKVSGSKLSNFLSSSASLAEKSRMIFSYALENGSVDDLSLILIRKIN